MKRIRIKIIVLTLILLNGWALSGQKHQHQKPTIRTFEASEKISVESSQELLKSEFGQALKPMISLTEIGHNDDPRHAFAHHKYDVKYQGVPIEFGEYTIHTDQNNEVYAISGRVEIGDFKMATPAFDQKQGLEFATEFIGANAYTWDPTMEDNAFGLLKAPTGELMILPILPGITTEARLVYKYLISAIDPLYIADVYVDALNGEVLFENTKMCTMHAAPPPPSNGTAYYNGTVNFTSEFFNSNYRLKNTTISTGGIHTIDGQGSSNYSSDIQSNTTAFNHLEGVQAHWAGEQTYNYFLSTHGRDSYNGNGAQIKLRVNDAVANNASWVYNLANFGSGDGVNHGSFTSCDVVGHEITHGVVQQSANLIYYGESGALNESFADIFGESIENYATNTNDWEMGAEIKLTPGQAFRSFADPNKFNHPDSYNGLHWESGPFDNGGVHINSGVQNHWFYLLVNGGSGTNDDGDSYNVTGIGMAKAQAISYRNLTVYLTQNSRYVDAWIGAIQSAKDLYGVNAPEVQSVVDAWYAVGIGDNGGAANCGSDPLSITIHFDDQPQFFGWRIMDKNNVLVAAKFMGAYSSQTPGTTLTEAIPLNKGGMYTFYTYDRSTNGLIHGNYTGGYQLKSGSNVLIQGNSFEVTEGRVFCYEFDSGNGQDINPPTDVGPVSVSNIGSDGARLSWSTSSDANGINAYAIIWDGNIQTTQNIDYIFSSLQANTSYTMKVYAVDNYGNFSEQGALATFTTTAQSDNTPPTAPTNLVVSGETPTSFMLNWTASTDNVGLVGYNVYIDNQLETTVTSTNATISNKMPTTTYDCQIKAIDAANNESTGSNIAQATTSGNGSRCSNGPLNLAITFDNRPEDIGWELKNTTLGWEAYSNSGAYANQTAGSTLNVALPNLGQGDYLLVMYDINGDGLCCNNGQGGFEVTDNIGSLINDSQYAWSSVLPFCVDNSNGFMFDLIPPTDPSNLSAINPSPTTVDISWTPSTDNDVLFGYGLFLNGTYAGYVANNITSFTWPNLTPNTSYTLSVLARDVTGNFSNLSQSVSWTTLPLVTEVVLHEGYFESGWDGWIDGGAHCHRYNGWKSYEGTRSIRLRNNNGGASSMTLPNVDMSSLDDATISFKFYANGMESGKDFFVKYRDGSTWHTIGTFVSGQDFSNNSFDSVSITIDKNMYTFPSNAKFRIQADGNNNSDKIFVDEVKIKGTLTPPSMPSIQEASIDYALFGHGKDLASIDQDVKRQMMDDLVKIYPNPASESFSLQGLSNDDINVIKLYDVQGLLKHSYSTATNNDISALQPGAFILSIEMKDGTIKTTTLIVN